MYTRRYFINYNNINNTNDIKKFTYSFMLQFNTKEVIKISFHFNTHDIKFNAGF